MEADKVALGINRKKPRLFSDEIWKFQILLRRLEHTINCRQSRLWNPYRYYLMQRFRWASIRLGFEIPPNVFGPGLRISHRGTIVVSPSVRAGENVSLQVDVVIGVKSRLDSSAPRIGNNVFVGAGAKIIGGIEIADNIAISSMSLVNRSFSEPGITVGGVPARRLNSRGSEGLVVKASDVIRESRAGAHRI